jgi:hypothetical protein
MKRTVLAAALSVGAVLAIPLPAAAVPPERVVSEVFDADVTVVDEFLTAECGFRVTARVAGHFRLTEFYNRDGSLNRVTAHPSFRSTLTGPTGTTITTADVGLDRFVENADGTVSVFGTGIHLKLKGGEKAIGLWRLTFDATEELISEEYHGRFDVDAAGTTQAICEALS